MVLTNIVYRTFFIRAVEYGTAFAVDVHGAQYFVTAKHLVDPTKHTHPFSLFHNQRWMEVSAELVGHGSGEVDISVYQVGHRLARESLTVTPSMGDLMLGQDVFFLGFPYKMWGNVGQFLNGLPCPYVKKGVLSLLSTDLPRTLYVDAINNEGFSGGPLYFFPHSNPTELRIAGVVSKFRTEHEVVLDKDGEPTQMTVPYNTGFLVAYGIQHAIEIINSATSS